MGEQGKRGGEVIGQFSSRSWVFKLFYMTLPMRLQSVNKRKSHIGLEYPESVREQERLEII
jgi:hypothetical protein